VVQHLRTFDSFWRSAGVGALLALACPILPLHAQEVYKSVDAEGHVVYSDRGVTKTAPKTAVHVDQPEAAEVARLAKEQELLKAEDMQRQKQEALDAKNKAFADQRKQTACQNARNYYFRLKDSGRLYQRDADGNRVYYSDADADSMREQARKAMTSACGT
jgi:hypothetical protein